MLNPGYTTISKFLIQQVPRGHTVANSRRCWWTWPP